MRGRHKERYKSVERGGKKRDENADPERDTCEYFGIPESYLEELFRLLTALRQWSGTTLILLGSQVLFWVRVSLFESGPVDMQTCVFT